MKIDRYIRWLRETGVKHRRVNGGRPSRSGSFGQTSLCLLLLSLSVSVAPSEAADREDAQLAESASAEQESDPKALLLVNQLLERLANGPAFDAKVRERVWTTGREVLGVGTYEQAGGGSGQFNLQVTMLDGDGKHTLQQISDGRLTWTRTAIAGQVSLRRVDVGRLDEWVHDTTRQANVPPRLRVGAWTELLDTLQRDYVLSLGTSLLKAKSVIVITGNLRSHARKKVLEESKLEQWPALCPTKIHVAVATEPDPQSRFGKGLPVRFEFWSDPQAFVTQPRDVEESTESSRRLITLIELYSIRPIDPPPIQRFRFENQDAEVNFINETDRYLNRYGVRLTESQRHQLRR